MGLLLNRLKDRCRLWTFEREGGEYKYEECPFECVYPCECECFVMGLLLNRSKDRGHLWTFELEGGEYKYEECACDCECVCEDEPKE